VAEVGSLGRAEGEVHGAGVLHLQCLRVVERPHRRGIELRDEHANNRALRRRRSCTLDDRDVGDHNTGLGQEPELEQECVRPPDGVEQRGPAKELGDHDRDEVGLAAGEPPYLLQDRLVDPERAVHHLEQRLLV
jgi:hypothetical protein